MKKQDERKLNTALNEAIKNEAEALDFFADFDMTKPPIEKIYEAAENPDFAERAAGDERVQIARSRKKYYMSFAAMAACFVLMVASVATGGGFDWLRSNLTDSASLDAGMTSESTTDSAQPAAPGEALPEDESAEQSSSDQEPTGGGESGYTDAQSDGESSSSTPPVETPPETDSNAAAPPEVAPPAGSGQTDETEGMNSASSGVSVDVPALPDKVVTQEEKALASAPSIDDASLPDAPASDEPARDSGSGALHKGIAIAAAILFLAALILTIGFRRTIKSPKNR
jgi:hypothetical protein